ncbi:hypothetical protein ACIRSJ_20835 [Streptomyces virginiae]|uniref:hypothetical protein n=1 Tax=Streptomyces virginiae TaxID=1961 RepID=UPI00383005CF
MSKDPDHREGAWVVAATMSVLMLGAVAIGTSSSEDKPEPYKAPSHPYQYTPPTTSTPVPSTMPSRATPTPPISTHKPPNDGSGPSGSRGSNPGYYDGNYDNDDEWHRDHGNADEYYDGNYNNDGAYHDKYGSGRRGRPNLH